MAVHMVVPVAYGGFFCEEDKENVTHFVKELNVDYKGNRLGLSSRGSEALCQLLDGGWKIVSIQSCSCGEGTSSRAVFQYVLESPELPGRVE